MIKHNVVYIAVLRIYVGKVQSVSSLLYAIRPFVSELWAAIQAPSDGAPASEIWRSRMIHALTQLQCFLASSEGGPLIRTFWANTDVGDLGNLLIGIDASPWSLGGWLASECNIIAYSAELAHNEDIQQFDATPGDPRASRCMGL